jgi:hypothetical protein
MDSHQAKQVLALYRPGSVDASDPEVAEALDEARRNPELGRWFAQHCAFQASVRAGFRTIGVPEGLKERLLAGPGPRVIQVWWRKPAMLGAAAAMVALIALAGFWFRPQEDMGFSAYRDRMVRTALRGYRMDLLTNDLTQIREFLAKSRTHADYVLAPGLEKLPGEGCAVLGWQGQPVAMICFDLGNKQELYLFVINRSALPNAPPTKTPEFVKVNKLITASWSAGDKVYILAGQGDQNSIAKHL